jgi:hypothetical protein
MAGSRNSSGPEGVHQTAVGGLTDCDIRTMSNHKPHDPAVGIVEPGSPSPCDERHIKTYLGLLEVEEGADWREVVQIIFGFEPARAFGNMPGVIPIRGHVFDELPERDDETTLDVRASRAIGGGRPFLARDIDFQGQIPGR